jgi:hypothetical protein
MPALPGSWDDRREERLLRAGHSPGALGFCPASTKIRREAPVINLLVFSLVGRCHGLLQKRGQKKGASSRTPNPNREIKTSQTPRFGRSAWQNFQERQEESGLPATAMSAALTGWEYARFPPGPFDLDQTRFILLRISVS